VQRFPPPGPGLLTGESAEVLGRRAAIDLCYWHEVSTLTTGALGPCGLRIICQVGFPRSLSVALCTSRLCLCCRPPPLHVAEDLA
jgi:hypothetical protein